MDGLFPEHSDQLQQDDHTRVLAFESMAPGEVTAADIAWASHRILELETTLAEAQQVAHVVAPLAHWPTRERWHRSADEAISTWADALTDAAGAALSAHDLAALRCTVVDCMEYAYVDPEVADATD